MKTTTETKSGNLARRVLKWIAIVVPVLLVVAYLAVGAVAAETLTRPKRDFSVQENPATFNLAYQDVRFPSRSGDAQIAGWFIPREESKRAIVLVHGKDCSRTSEFYGEFTDFAAALNRGGFSVLMIDLRGHGQSSDAHFSFGLNERRDVEGAVDWLKSQGFQPGSIGVLGVSLGAASSIGATADDPDIGALVEDSGFASICPIIQNQWNNASGLPDVFLPPSLFMVQFRFGYDLCASRPVDEIGRIAPRAVLIIHSTSDALVPIANATQLKAAAPFAETWIVTGPEHARIYNSDPATYNQKVIDFFDRNLKK
jgi:pimeloyl-ACP methyl ester carboxylesterase